MTTKHPNVKPYGESYMASHLQQYLQPAITAREITTRLGVRSLGRSGDGKAQHTWQFVFVGPDGAEHDCAIWDYKGRKWSTYGPRECFESLFPGQVLESSFPY